MAGVPLTSAPSGGYNVVPLFQSRNATYLVQTYTLPCCGDHPQDRDQPDMVTDVPKEMAGQKSVVEMATDMTMRVTNEQAQATAQDVISSDVVEN